MGCVSNGFDVDGVSILDLTAAQYEQVIERVFAEIRAGIAEGTVLLTDVVDCLQYDNCEWDDTPCGQCGDTVTTTTWIL